MSGQIRSTPPWTKAQQSAITLTDANILVSAAAGSGKTAVLAERCVYLVCDALDKCGVDELLVVTFTRAAAGEMRSRVEARLLDRAAQSTDKNLLRQIRLLDRAEIGTLHGFCQKIIRRHFEVLGIDPTFSTLDEHEALLLRHEVAERLFERRFGDAERGEAFLRFIDSFAYGRTDILREALLRAYAMAESTADPANWTMGTIQRLHEAATRPLHESQLGRLFIDEIDADLADLVERGERAQSDARRHFAGYDDSFDDIMAELTREREALRLTGFDAMVALIGAYKVPDAPTFRNLDPGEKEQKEGAKDYYDKFRGQLTRALRAKVVGFTEVLWHEGLVEAAASAETLVSLIDEFRTDYTAAKQAIRSVDFADLERLAFAVLRDPNTPPDAEPRPSPAARMYQAQFRHVLVDEYQDINELQDQILRLVSRESAVQSKDNGSSRFTPNLFCVGDVKQSIYRFRLADPHRFLRREDTYERDEKAGRLIPLSENFRSTPQVIDAINAVFRRLMSRAGAEVQYTNKHELRPGKPLESYSPLAAESGAAVELHVMPAPPRTRTDGGDQPEKEDYDADSSEPKPDQQPEVEELDKTEREAAVVAQSLRDLVGGPDGFRYGDVVILLRAMRFKSQQFATLLRQFDVPVFADTSGGFFECMEIRDVLSLLRVMDNPLQDIPLAGLLRSPLIRLENADDALANVRARYLGEKSKPFHRAVVDFAAARKAAGQNDADAALAQRLSEILAKIKTWRDAVHRRPLAGVLWEILESSGYLAFCASLRNGEGRIANLHYLHDLARTFGTFQKQGLRRFLAFLEALAEQERLGEAVPVSSTPLDAVRVMSIHASKGLQYPVVIVPDLSKEMNRMDLRSSILLERELGIAPMVVDLTRRVRYPSLASTVAKAKLARQLAAEEMRVLYVAMTRAQRKLILLGSVDDPEKRTSQWAAQWSRQGGALPASLVRGAKSMLDWLGPAHAAIAAQESAELVRMRTWEESEVKTILDRAVERSGANVKIDPKLAVLEPLGEPLPTESAAAKRTIDEVSWQHPMRAYSHVPAARAVTQLTKTGRRATAGENPSEREIVRFTRQLRPPRFVSPSKKPQPTEIGVATHRVLQSLRLESTPPTRPSVRAEIERLVDRKIISRLQAGAVDVEAIAWFLSSDLGQLLRSNASSSWRELPVFAPIIDITPTETTPQTLPPSDDPRDRTLLRGQIDVLIRLLNGLVVIDYKTDAITPETLADRVNFYRPQVNVYADAMAKIAGVPVIGRHLVFLSLRRSVDV